MHASHRRAMRSKGLAMDDLLQESKVFSLLPQTHANRLECVNSWLATGQSRPRLESLTLLRFPTATERDYEQHMQSFLRGQVIFVLFLWSALHISLSIFAMIPMPLAHGNTFTAHGWHVHLIVAISLITLLLLHYGLRKLCALKNRGWGRLVVAVITFEEICLSVATQDTSLSSSLIAWSFLVHASGILFHREALLVSVAVSVNWLMIYPLFNIVPQYPSTWVHNVFILSMAQVLGLLTGFQLEWGHRYQFSMHPHIESWKKVRKAFSNATAAVDRRIRPPRPLSTRLYTHSQLNASLRVVTEHHVVLVAMRVPLTLQTLKTHHAGMNTRDLTAALAKKMQELMGGLAASVEGLPSMALMRAHGQELWFIGGLPENFMQTVARAPVATAAGVFGQQVGETGDATTVIRPRYPYEAADLALVLQQKAQIELGRENLNVRPTIVLHTGLVRLGMGENHETTMEVVGHTVDRCQSLLYQSPSESTASVSLPAALNDMRRELLTTIGCSTDYAQLIQDEFELGPTRDHLCELRGRKSSLRKTHAYNLSGVKRHAPALAPTTYPSDDDDSGSATSAKDTRNHFLHRDSDSEGSGVEMASTDQGYERPDIPPTLWVRLDGTKAKVHTYYHENVRKTMETMRGNVLATYREKYQAVFAEKRDVAEAIRLAERDARDTVIKSNMGLAKLLKTLTWNDRYLFHQRDLLPWQRTFQMAFFLSMIIYLIISIIHWPHEIMTMDMTITYTFTGLFVLRLFAWAFFLLSIPCASNGMPCVAQMAQALHFVHVLVMAGAIWVVPYRGVLALYTVLMATTTLTARLFYTVALNFSLFLILSTEISELISTHTLRSVLLPSLALLVTGIRLQFLRTELTAHGFSLQTESQTIVAKMQDKHRRLEMSVMTLVSNPHVQNTLTHASTDHFLETRASRFTPSVATEQPMPMLRRQWIEKCRNQPEWDGILVGNCFVLSVRLMVTGMVSPEKHLLTLMYFTRQCDEKLRNQLNLDTLQRVKCSMDHLVYVLYLNEMNASHDMPSRIVRDLFDVSHDYYGKINEEIMANVDVCMTASQGIVYCAMGQRYVRKHYDVYGAPLDAIADMESLLEFNAGTLTVRASDIKILERLVRHGEDTFVQKKHDHPRSDAHYIIEKTRDIDFSYLRKQDETSRKEVTLPKEVS